jgi:nicotinate-nucleotide adenylyltransferase
MRLGLLGGSFNPIHHGHLITAVRAAEAARLDRVLFIPASVSPLKGGRSLASARDRWTML